MRIRYIDAMKGIGILLVLLGHSIGDMGVPLNTALLSFHMPLFFFVSGMLFYGRERKLCSFWPFLKKKIFALLVPVVTYAVLSMIAYLVIDCLLLKEGFAFSKLLGSFGNWFLITLFLANIICFLVFGLLGKKNALLGIVGAAFAVAFCFISYDGYLQQVVCAMIFCILGYFLRPVLDKYAQRSKIKGIWILGLCLTAFLSSYNLPVGMYMNQYGNKLFFLLVAVIGIFSVVDLAVCLQEQKWFLSAGENSIVLFITHFFVLRVIKAILARLFHVSPETYPYYLLAFLLLVLAEIPVVWFCNRFVPFLFGKKSPVK